MNSYWATFSQYFTFLILVLMIFQVDLMAQDVLTIDRAIEITLENNPTIKALRNNREIAINNADRGNAGQLPSVALSGSSNYSINNTKLEFAGEIPEVNVPGAASFTNQAGLLVNYTLFDGLAMFKNYKRLQLIYEQVDAESKTQIELILLSLINNFYRAVLFESYRETAIRQLNISQERLERIKVRTKSGAGSGLELLAAEVDFSNDSIAFLEADFNCKNQIIELKAIFGKEIGDNYQLEKEINYKADLLYESFLEKSKIQNTAMKTAQKQKELAEVDVALNNATRLPTIGLNGGYLFNRQVNEAGLILVNQSDGFNVGLSLNYNLFDGNRRGIANQNAKILRENAFLSLEQTTLNLERDLASAFANYQKGLAVLNLQNASINAAEKNFERAQELFRVGFINNTQFREAQLNLSKAKNKQMEAVFNVKMSEMELYRLSGSLLELF